MRGGTIPMPQPEDDDSVTMIRNIGPAMAADMARAGITSATALRAMGADAAYGAMIATGTRPHFIGYYVLHMALQGRPWNDCKGAEKTALRARFDTLKAGLADPLHDSAFERLLNEIGTGQRR
ncbi:TfoX/Sxy family protein [Roseicyclus sp.]|uniref:TfoX/Sxy family protein n=1 Tax=Roseicyclus sp. TaxID=1914329 RepID=UPI003F6AEF7A